MFTTKCTDVGDFKDGAVFYCGADEGMLEMEWEAGEGKREGYDVGG